MNYHTTHKNPKPLTNKININLFMPDIRSLPLRNPKPPATTTTTPPSPATPTPLHPTQIKTQHILENNKMQKSQNDTTTIRVLEAATSSSSPPSTTTTNGSAAPACAACRHQRKKCTKKCVLAPFFPVEKTQDFQAVPRVFGVSNVTKLLKDLSTEDRKKAVDSLIWEANCRIKDPVLGSLGEFQRVCEELNFYKTQLLANVPVMQSVDTNGNIDNGSKLDCIHSYGNNGGTDHSTRMFYYRSSQSMERVEHKRDQQGSLIHQQQQMMNDFSEFY